MSRRFVCPGCRLTATRTATHAVHVSNGLPTCFPPVWIDDADDVVAWGIFTTADVCIGIHDERDEAVRKAESYNAKELDGRPVTVAALVRRSV